MAWAYDPTEGDPFHPQSCAWSFNVKSIAAPRLPTNVRMPVQSVVQVCPVLSHVFWPVIAKPHAPVISVLPCDKHTIAQIQAKYCAKK